MTSDGAQPPAVMPSTCAEIEGGDWPFFGDTPPATWGPTLLHTREVHDDRDPYQAWIRALPEHDDTDTGREPVYPCPWAHDPGAACVGLEQR